MNYYNENDPYAAAWLENLMRERHIGQGLVDSRSIHDVRPEDVKDARRAHFFAGIGVWEHALDLAGWPRKQEVWTGSCPCQPFSVAGRGKGVDDERHLWPEWLRLIRECRPPVIFGEQVASADGRAWLNTVRADLEALGYAVGAADLCAACVGAPHIRQRLYFVGIRLADTDAAGRVELGCRGLREDGHTPQRHNTDGQRLGDAEREGLEGHRQPVDLDASGGWQDSQRHHATTGFWSDPDWVACRDGKQRPVEPGSFPLAHGATARVGKLRAFGNAIVSEVAATFIKAVMQTMEDS